MNDLDISWSYGEILISYAKIKKADAINKLKKVKELIEYLMTIDLTLLPLTTLIVYSLRLSQRVRYIITTMGNYISSMMKKEMRYGESNDFEK